MSDEPNGDPLAHVRINGKSYPVYPPTGDLWDKLRHAEDVLKNEGYVEILWPNLVRAGVLGAVADECCRLPGRGPTDKFVRIAMRLPLRDPFNPTWKVSRENLKAVLDIIGTWNKSRYWHNYYYGFILKCLEMVITHYEEEERRISLIRDPHPELREEAIAAGSAAAAFVAPIPTDLYEEEIEPDASSKRKPSPEPPDIDDLADSLRAERPRSGYQAALLEFMKNRTTATYQDLAEQVHGDKDTTENAIRSNVKRVNQFLTEKARPCRFACGSGRVVKISSPE